MAKDVILTQEGVKKLEDKLEYLRSVRRKEVAERIQVAISFGDLSENAEYDEAKNEQAFVEGEILQIENTLRTAQVLDAQEESQNAVGIGSTVTVFDEDLGEEETYTICGSAEANPFENQISNESPIAQALLGRYPGETVDVQAPVGIIKLKILSTVRN